MKRLCERRGALTEAEQRLLDLLETHHPEPLGDLDKARILTRLRSAPSRARPARLLRLAAMATLLTSGTLLGAWGSGWLGASDTDPATTAPATVPPAPPGHSIEPAGLREMPDAIEGTSPDPEEPDAGDSAIVESPPATTAATPRRTPPRPASAGEDPTLVAEALRAMRQQDEPERAEELLRRYRTENPDGTLSEDALALSIEAAAGRDRARAARLAREYLAKYPDGRYRATAERALRLEASP